MNQKRLCKGHSKMLAGVCSGLAEYMGWDPTVVRIATALLCLVWGTGLLLYIIAAFHTAELVYAGQAPACCCISLRHL